MKIGYIGIGLMGFPCCRHLLAKGYALGIWARSREKAQPLLELGATWHATPAALAQEVDILFTNVSNTQDVEQVLFGNEGAASSGKKGLIVVDMSTISATASIRFAEKLRALGMEFVDAPVSGGTVGAENATLTFMVGAPLDVFERIRPVLSAMGSTITRIGETGSGQIAKSCNQICITGAIAAVAEAFSLAIANNVDPSAVREALLGGLAQSKVLDIHGKRIIEDIFTPGFKTELHLKDMRIVKEVAKDAQLNVPITDMGIFLLEKAMENGRNQEDSAVIAKFYDQLPGGK